MGRLCDYVVLKRWKNGERGRTFEYALTSDPGNAIYWSWLQSRVTEMDLHDLMKKAVGESTKREVWADKVEAALGTCVIVLPWHDPIRVAEQIALLDVMSGGRLELGVGRGASPYEAEFFGIEPSTAQERFDESLEIVLKGLGADRLDHAGKYFTFKNVPLVMQPVQRPRLTAQFGGRALAVHDAAAGMHPGDRARLNALYMTSIFVGGAIGSALASPVYERFGWSGTALLAAGLPLLALLVFIGKEKLGVGANTKIAGNKKPA